MGLDSVELILCIEQSFDVRILDEEAGDVRTVGDLFNLIVRLKGDVPIKKDVCLSAAVFFRIRRALARQLGIESKTIRPATWLDTVVPCEDRRGLWLRLAKTLGWRLPPLLRPWWMVAVATILSLAAIYCAGVLGAWIGGSVGAAGLALAAFFGVPLAAMWITAPLATRFGPTFRTFRGLSEWVLAWNYAVVCEEIGGWDSAEAWESLRRIVVEQTGVHPEKVAWDTHFVKDLGVD